MGYLPLQTQVVPLLADLRNQRQCLLPHAPRFDWLTALAQVVGVRQQNSYQQIASLIGL